MATERVMRRMIFNMAIHRSQSGFTLVEMIIVIVITGILGGMVAVFLKAPIQGYMDSTRRAEMTDIADSTLRRLERDLRTALPNSVRIYGAVSGSGSCNGTETCYLEYLETIAGGRYNSSTNPTDCLNQTSGVAAVPCTSLTTTGDLVSGGANTASTTLLNGKTLTLNTSRLVLYNQYNNTSSDCSNLNPSVYCATGNTVATTKGGAPVITGVSNGSTDATADVITFASNTFLPAGGSPYNRFQIVSGPVTYVCIPGTTLTRYWGYAIQATQPNDITAIPLNGASNSILAGNIGATCNFKYDGSVVAQSYGLVTLNLSISEWNATTGSNESVALYSAIHVSNIP